MHPKHIARLGAILVYLLLLAGCGGGGDSPPASQTPVVAQNADWARRSVFYEVFVRSFYDGNNDSIGDFKGVTAKLDYLKGLGIDALWLMPIYPASSYHGYDIKDYTTVNPDYGTMDDFRELINTAHSKGMKVVIDWVVNHTSNEHEWFKKSFAGDPEYAGYYRWSNTRIDDNWVLASNGRYYYAWYGNPNMPKLDYTNPKVREKIKSLAAFWLQQGVDGFRLDVAQSIGGSDTALTYSWWSEFQSYVRTIKPTAYIVGEVNYDQLDGNTHHAPFYQGMNSTFNFPAYNYLLGMSTGLTRDVVGALSAAHDEYALYNPDYIDAITLGNHDRSRIASRLNFDLRLMKHAVNVMMTLPGTPFLYYGEEIGMGGGHNQQADPNKREPFDWYRSGTGPGMAGMTKAVYGAVAKNIIPSDGISFEEQQANPDGIYAHYRKMIALCHANPMLFDGHIQRIGTPADTYGYKVSAAGVSEAYYVVHNQSLTAASSLKLTESATELMSGKVYKAGDTVPLPEFGTVILKAKASQLPLAPMDVVNAANPIFRMTFRVHVPPQTPADSPVYMPNSDDGWDPTVIEACAPCTATKLGDGLYAITLQRERGTILEYKYFRDKGWDSSESEADGNWNGNREAVFKTQDAVVDDTVVGWRDTNNHP